MKAHEILEKFLSFSFRVKLGLILLVLVAIGIAGTLIYRAGVRAGDLQAEIRYTEREKEFQKKNAESAAVADEAIKRAADYQESANQKAAENYLLKEHQKLQAQISTERDDRIRQERTEKENKLFKEKENKLYEINNQTGFDANNCALCREYAALGAKLSDEFCGRCLETK